MKKILIVFAFVLCFGMAFYPVSGQSQDGSRYGGGPGYGQGMGPGMMGGYGPGGGGGGWSCPYCGSHMGGYGPQSQYQQPQKPIDEKEAASLAARYIQRNPNLKIGAVKNVGNAFEVEIKAKDNTLVDKILVDKNTGWVRSAYQESVVL